MLGAVPLPASITIDIDPMIDLGPLSLAWHGLTTALGIFLGTLVAVRHARSRGLDADALVSAVLWLAGVGIVGARLVYLLEQGGGAVLQPDGWLDSRGFSFYGGLIFGTTAAAFYLRRHRLGVRYLDAMVVGFPLGMAVGRIGDLINGEHYGAATDVPWGIRYSHPAADVPSADLAYHAGGLYEIVLALAIGVALWLLRGRLSSPGQLLWSVVGLYAAGRFVMFFYRVDSEPLALGLDTSQWISLLLLLVAGLGLALSASEGARRRLGRAVKAAGSGAALVLVAALVAGCGGGDGSAGAPGADEPLVEDPWPVHVHGLGVNPADGALFLATHTGLFRLPPGEENAERVAGRYQDTMAFAVAGLDRFRGSGHPDGRENLPPFLGLIESRDAGESWKPISLQGRMDFHLLALAGQRVYGYGSDFKTREERFLASQDAGRSWSDRRAPEPLQSLALDPGNSRRLVAAGEGGLHISSDSGSTWRALPGTPGLLSWPIRERLYAVDDRGVVRLSGDSGRRWRVVGRLGGTPAAFNFASQGRLLAALHDGTVEESTDGGVTWEVRANPPRADG